MVGWPVRAIFHHQFYVSQLAAQTDFSAPGFGRGKNPADFIGELLQALLQPLPPISRLWATTSRSISARLGNDLFG